MSYDWGPYFIVPSKAIKEYSGHVQLREQLDENLLAKELRELSISGSILKIANPWYLRKRVKTHGLRSGNQKQSRTTSRCPGTQLIWTMVSMRCWDSCMCS